MSQLCSGKIIMADFVHLCFYSWGMAQFGYLEILRQKRQNSWLQTSSQNYISTTIYSRGRKLVFYSRDSLLSKLFLAKKYTAMLMAWAMNLYTIKVESKGYKSGYLASISASQAKLCKPKLWSGISHHRSGQAKVENEISGSNFDWHLVTNSAHFWWSYYY